MSKRTVVVIVCDMPHDLNDPLAEAGAATVTIDAGDGAYTVDMCDVHRLEHLGPLAAYGTRVRRTRQRK
jgi:hypothetical protein